MRGLWRWLRNTPELETKDRVIELLLLENERLLVQIADLKKGKTTRKQRKAMNNPWKGEETL